MVVWCGLTSAGRLLSLLAVLLSPFIAFARPASAQDCLALPVVEGHHHHLPYATTGEPIPAVTLDQATIIGLPGRAKTIVLGNPLIADITMLRFEGGNLVVAITGKGFGSTNLIAFDHQGCELTRKIIEVTAPTDVLVVHNGTEQETYSCKPICGPRITLGNSADFFARALSQTNNRNNGVGEMVKSGGGE